MEFDSTLYSARNRRRNVALLLPQTFDLLDAYSQFYAVPQDQIVEYALGRLFAADSEFVEHVQSKKLS